MRKSGGKIGRKLPYRILQFGFEAAILCASAFCLVFLVACATDITKPTRIQRSDELLRSGMDQYLKGNLAGAMERFHMALDTNASVDNQKGVAEALNNIAAVHVRQENYQEALATYESALDVYNSVGNFHGITTVLLNMGSVFSAIQNAGSAERHYTMALEKARAEKLKSLEAKALNNLGLLKKESGDLTEAHQFYEGSLEINRRENKAAAMADNLNNLGTLSLRLGNPEQALDYFEHALEIDKELELPEAIALDLFNIASVYHTRKDFPASLNYYGRALAIYDFTSNLPRAAETLYRIGLVNEGIGNTDRALESYRAALKTAESTGAEALAETIRTKARSSSKAASPPLSD